MHFLFFSILTIASSLVSVVVFNHITRMSSAVPISSGDPSSYSNADAFILKHLSLSWTVDFDSKTITGSAELTIESNPHRAADVDVSRLILDTRDLNVSSVKWKGGDATELPFFLGTPHSAFGAALVIDLPEAVRSAEASFIVVIRYSTTPACSALQWLEPRQTAGKKKPFLFSQCQAIHARSLVPCQDTPAVKFTYDAKVNSPADLVVLMSAVKNEVSFLRCVRKCSKCIRYMYS